MTPPPFTTSSCARCSGRSLIYHTTASITAVAQLHFSFSLSSWCYHTLSEAKAAHLRSKGIPALAYLDDSWLSNFRVSHGREVRAQWLAAGEATHVAKLVSFLCGQFLSAKRCDFRPTR